MNEPSVLDYLKSLFNRSKNRIHLFSTNSIDQDVKNETSGWINNEQERKISFPWKIVISVFSVLLAQTFLEPPQRQTTIAIGLYIFAAIIFWSSLKIYLSKTQDIVNPQISLKIHLISFTASLLFLLAAFWTFNNNTFTVVNISLWFFGIVLFLFSVWEKKQKKGKAQISFNYWILLFLSVIGIVIFFRVFQLSQVPGEMWSDHAEKLLDIADILNGKTSIFFIRNTGREAIQFYLTAAIIKLFGTGLTFISLKIGTVLIGLLTLPFIYLLGKELSDRWTGLVSLFMAGIAYWPNIISRVGLRYPLYPFFTAPALYFLIRGLRNFNRNDFVLSGIALGIGLHGYSPIRILPFILVFGVGIVWLNTKSRDSKKQLFWSLGLLGLTAFVFFLPLFRYAVDNPAEFGFRALSRVTSIEQPLPGPAGLIFLSNLWNAITMFFYSNGGIWVHSIPFRPALDVVMAAFLFLGILFLIKRYIIQREWLDLFLLISIPLLLMPSILSLAFPSENPSLNRTSGAIIPVFIIAALGFVETFHQILNNLKTKMQKGIIICFMISLLFWSTVSNYNLVFNEYNQQFMANAWNTSEIGQVIRNFINQGGNSDQAYVVPYPYWVDTRLVGINAGFPLKDYALIPNQFNSTISQNNPKLFILKPEDKNSITTLQQIYPKSTEEVYVSITPGKNFIILHIP